MDQTTLVGKRMEDGSLLVRQLANDSFDVKAAFWLKGPDDAWPYLFISSSVVQDDSPGEAFRRLQPSLKKLAGTCVSLTDIKLIGQWNALTVEVLRLQEQYGRSSPLWIHDTRLANLAVDELYVYPSVPRASSSPIRLGKRRLK